MHALTTKYLMEIRGEQRQLAKSILAELLAASPASRGAAIKPLWLCWNPSDGKDMIFQVSPAKTSDLRKFDCSI